MKRPDGTGTLYVKWGSYYGRWIAPDGRRVNRKIGNVRVRGESGGLTRREAERGLRRLIEAQSRRPAPSPEERAPTVDEVADAVRERIALEGARLAESFVDTIKTELIADRVWRSRDQLAIVEYLGWFTTRACTNPSATSPRRVRGPTRAAVRGIHSHQDLEPAIMVSAKPSPPQSSTAWRSAVEPVV